MKRKLWRRMEENAAHKARQSWSASWPILASMASMSHDTNKRSKRKSCWQVKVFIIQVVGSISEEQFQDFKRESECPTSRETKSASKIWFPANSLGILSALQNWLLLSLPFSRNYSLPPYDSPVVQTRWDFLVFSCLPFFVEILTQEIIQRMENTP